MISTIYSQWRSVNDASVRYLLSILEGDSSWEGGKPPKAEAPPAEPKSALEMIMEQLPKEQK